MEQPKCPHCDNDISEIAKRHVFAFLKFKEEYQRSERRSHIERQATEGMYSWVGLPDESIYELFIKQ